MNDEYEDVPTPFDPTNVNGPMKRGPGRPRKNPDHVPPRPIDRDGPGPLAGKPLVLPQDLPDTIRASMADAFLWEERTPDYVPGHAELVMANEISANRRLSTEEKEKHFQRLGTRGGPLPAELGWVRILGVNGGYSASASIDAAEWKRKGYKPAREEDLKRLGWKLPPAAHVEPDGTIRREDTALWIVDGDLARLHERRRLEAARDSDKPVDTTGHSQHQPITVREETRETVTL